MTTKALAGDERPLHPLDEGQRMGQIIVNCIKDDCEQVLVCGSIRRQKPQVHDVDIVLIPKPFMWSGVILGRIMKYAEATGSKVSIIKSGSQLAEITYRDWNIDFWVATQKNWGLMTLLKTGSYQHNILLASVAKRRGGIITNQPDMTTEEAMFKCLGWSYVPPEKREVKWQKKETKSDE